MNRSLTLPPLVLAASSPSFGSKFGYSEYDRPSKPRWVLVVLWTLPLSSRSLPIPPIPPSVPTISQKERAEHASVASDSFVPSRRKDDWAEKEEDVGYG